MAPTPPTVADLEAEVADQCATALAEAGAYLRALDEGGVAFTPAIRRGLRRGAKAVGLHLAAPLDLTDADVANLSPWALEHVLAHGQLAALREALLHWHRAAQKHEDAVSPAPQTGGWLEAERRAVRERVAELRATCERPYREPADPIVVAQPDPGPPPGRGWPWTWPWAGPWA